MALLYPELLNDSVCEYLYMGTPNKQSLLKTRL